jgi:hypothetical protein
MIWEKWAILFRTTLPESGFRNIWVEPVARRVKTFKAWWSI